MGVLNALFGATVALADTATEEAPGLLEGIFGEYTWVAILVVVLAIVAVVVALIVKGYLDEMKKQSKKSQKKSSRK